MSIERPINHDPVVQELQQPTLARFSEEARTALETAGFTIYSLSGREMHLEKPQYDLGSEIISVPTDNSIRLTSMRSEVAFDPNLTKVDRVPTMTESDELRHQYKTLKKIDEDAIDYGSSMQRDLGTRDIKAVLGTTADYIELFEQHLEAKGEYLFDHPYETKTGNIRRAQRWLRTNPPVEIPNRSSKKSFLMRWEPKSAREGGRKIDLKTKGIYEGTFRIIHLPLIVPTS